MADSLEDRKEASPSGEEGPASERDHIATEHDPAVGAVTVVVCSSCRRGDDAADLPRAGLLLAARTAEVAEDAGIQVRQVACLGNCGRGLSAAILRAGSWSYVFGDLDTDSGPDLVTGAKLFAGSRDGFMPFRERPKSLKRGLVARIPSFDSLKEIP